MKRRDLDSTYIKTYKKKMHEIWRFISSNPISGGATSPSNQELSVIDEEEEMNNEASNNNNAVQNEEEKTLELRNNQDSDMMINTTSCNN